MFGAWYSFDDWYGGTPTMAGSGDCPTMGMFTQDQCSQIAEPIPGQPFTRTADGRFCTAGTAARVIMDANGAAAYSAIWGAGIGFDLDTGSTAGAKLPWDATVHGVTGFGFTIEMPPVDGQMRVEFPTSAAPGVTDVKPAYWGGETMNLSPFTKQGTYAFHWADVGGPMGLDPHMAFDRTRIVSMQFHVVTNTSSAVPFNYCVSNIRALTD